MNKDKALEELFLAQKPHFDDNDAFMASLTKRLDAVEYIKQYQEATLRRYKMAMVVAFVAGIIGGAVGMVFLLSTPANVPLFTFRIQFIFLPPSYSRNILFTIVAVFCAKHEEALRIPCRALIVACYYA
jgi:hypothetical protein